ncbi:N-acetylmuramic acid 6-phosphate etherase [Clostridium tertium]|jgi:N-acetylmuramic acid 6-phosphate etherase|uniref:N-acetylmuramic acid 6-phosphate etherase n=1 Tax=Clostridium tertium TaxID=1559 RepID=A0A9X3XFX4_9CLOT|nr:MULTISPECIES: N-acetylmuramic acid 6-phosphate etherase [Clostridium]MBS5886708.1 N-acetylmuramic acid 6-phosphate etherase [Clostridium sp.]MBU6134474.1 N-acetylmuramic acid 6-phosphate etherase [Clostridium tertium]MDB1923861.1 N-acetylmuramic acid 6-phosphate etherase [Clostridium tertium]MDB1925006.1 N-acetylmuramic acid 6-phosphate etherase [Clostridium tertium]MDB1929330.1 N-acetylmuramic acid 6-phosphate etherase [Clostridium tertium]
MVDLTKLTTETRNKNTMNLDRMTSIEIAITMNKEDENVINSIRDTLPKISEVIDMCAKALKGGGRIIYMGAGTSGRLGLLDAVECPPTFGVPSDLVIGLIAGGESAFIKAVEGAEDSKTLGVDDLKNINLTNKDVVIGLAASGRTPYVIHGLKYAREIGCKTAIVVCNKDSEMAKYSDVAIEVVVGPEVLTGSTRLKAGTAQKMVLNMISTGSMVAVGKAYQNLMVDVMQTNEKLVVRAENIVIEATDCDRDTARRALKEANGKVKTAVVMILLNCKYDEAEERLKRAEGHVRFALENIN